MRPFHVAAWIEDFPGSKPTIKQKLAAVRMLYDFTLGAIERLAGSTIAETLGVNPQESKQIVNRFVPRGILRGVGCADSKIPFSVNLVLGTPKA